MKSKTWGFTIGVLLLTIGGYAVAPPPYKLAEASLDPSINPSAAQMEENSSVPGSDRRDDRRYEKPARMFDLFRSNLS
jgi:hypothetical protein